MCRSFPAWSPRGLAFDRDIRCDCNCAANLAALDATETWRLGSRALVQYLTDQQVAASLENLRPCKHAQAIRHRVHKMNQWAPFLIVRDRSSPREGFMLCTNRIAGQPGSVDFAGLAATILAAAAATPPKSPRTTGTAQSPAAPNAALLALPPHGPHALAAPLPPATPIANAAIAAKQTADALAGPTKNVTTDTADFDLTAGKQYRCLHQGSVKLNTSRMVVLHMKGSARRACVRWQLSRGTWLVQ
jgi:hypothetical protein